MAEKHIGNSKIKGDAIIPLSFQFKDRSVKLKHLSEELLTKLAKLDDLLNQINSLEIAGLAVSNKFGDNSYIGVSQKTLTNAINHIWSKLEDITGETLQGISMAVSPTYYIGEDGCTVNMNATTIDNNGIFERIAFYANGILVAEAENVTELNYSYNITETTVIKCEASILGVSYTKLDIIAHYSSFWLGTGSSYADIMNIGHLIPISNGMRGAYDITCEEGDHIIIVVGEKLASGFIRADINGMEIPFLETTVTVDDSTYKVFTSDGTYIAGNYNIDING